MPPAHCPSVLVVDDQPTIRTVLVGVLARHGGFEVAEANDGLAALAWIDRHQAACRTPGLCLPMLDLLVLDIMMPKLSGLEVIEALRWTYPTMPRTMVISALDDEEHVAEALRLGAIDYLPKPIDAGMFLHRVETLCSASVAVHFHWAPLANLPAIRLGNVPAEAKAISESGIIVQAGPQEQPAMGDVVELDSGVRRLWDSPSGARACRARHQVARTADDGAVVRRATRTRLVRHPALQRATLAEGQRPIRRASKRVTRVAPRRPSWARAFLDTVARYQSDERGAAVVE